MIESNLSSFDAKFVVNDSLDAKSNFLFVGFDIGTGSGGAKEAIASLVANFDDVFVTTFFIAAAATPLLFLFLAI